ncbi:hypothetical protein DL96DRAFT_324804 [Flagelloscypha sp. PMI_526]|nr:hypothetical protein DL96DRAFT_324804 [Flagelloscypha sp. PMI_526]
MFFNIQKYGEISTNAIQEITTTVPGPTMSNAMVALISMSIILWAGGQYTSLEHGLDCQSWIQVLHFYAKGILPPVNSWFNDGLTIGFAHIQAHDQVILLMSIWFDVWCSVTTGLTPVFIDLVEHHLRPAQFTAASFSNPFDLGACSNLLPSAWDIAPPTQPIAHSQLSSSSAAISGYVYTENAITRMEDIMGATSLTVWAIAKTCQLSSQFRAHQIYNNDMVNECSRILWELETEAQHLSLAPFYDNIHGGTTTSHSTLTKRVFNAAAQLSVCALIDHDEILSPLIQTAVELTMFHLREAARMPGQFSVVRSLYLPLFLCGALTKEEEIREEVKQIFFTHSQVRGKFGNGGLVLSVLENLWSSVQLDGNPTNVPWRQALTNSRVLLI